MTSSGSEPLPAFLLPYFWDQDFERLTWEAYPDFIIRRLLMSGSWEALVWLRRQLGDQALRQWLVEHRGAGLTPRQLRFWELVLELPHVDVNRWVEAGRNNPWQLRTQV